MNAHRLLLAAMIGFMVLGSFQVAAEEQEQKPYVGSEAFEQMKQLVGSWEGTMDMGKGPKKVTTSYKLTSGGSAIVETVFKGAPHEMVTVYHDDAHRQMQLTHYCTLGNQPKMGLTAMKGNELTFDLAKDADLDAAHDAHMHAMKITFNDKDTITQQWTQFEAGKEKQVAKVAYTRIK